MGGDKLLQFLDDNELMILRVEVMQRQLKDSEQMKRLE